MAALEWIAELGCFVAAYLEKMCRDLTMHIANKDLLYRVNLYSNDACGSS